MLPIFQLVHFQLIDLSIQQPIISALHQIKSNSSSRCVCVFHRGSRRAGGECEDTEGRKTRKTYMDLERPVTTLGGVHPFLCSGVNRFHVCLHFIYCCTRCSHHSGYKASPGYYCIFVRVAGEEDRGSTSPI